MIRLIWLFVCLPVAVAAQTENGIRFEQFSGWNQVKEKAKSERKYIFVDCYATWCVPCKKMDKEVYIDDSVGAFMNDRFVSVKVQMDRTKNDAQEITRWYEDAEMLASAFKVYAYPGFLFFDPEGRLVFKKAGYLSASEFLKVARNSLARENLKLYTRLQEYKKGVADTGSLMDLANYAKSLGEDTMARQIAVDHIGRTTENNMLNKENILFIRHVAKNEHLALKLAQKYNEACLDHLDENALFTKDNLEFINEFYPLIHSGDKFFKGCYFHPDKVDSIIVSPGWSRQIVDSVVTREEISVIADASMHEPDWKKMNHKISRKYKKVNAGLLVARYQLQYYRQRKDWRKYTSTMIQTVNKHGSFGPIQDVDFNLNNHAWEIFLHSDNRKELETALQWSDSAVNLALRSANQYNVPNWMDTKANLLYKLGRVREAIEVQQDAVALSPDAEDLLHNLKKMQQGRPTWKE